MYDSYLSLINIKYKEHISLFVLPLIFVLLFVLSLIIETSDRVKTKYLYSNNMFEITVPIENSDSVIKADYCILDDIKYSFKVTNIDYDLSSNYQIIDLEIETSKIDNQIGTIIFSYKKEKIIKKIIKLFF